jgi:hypothetical protein
MVAKIKDFGKIVGAKADVTGMAAKPPLVGRDYPHDT